MELTISVLGQYTQLQRKCFLLWFSFHTAHHHNRKENAKSIVGCAGIRSFLSALSPKYPDIKTVCIGGINASNLSRVIYQCGTPLKQLDGVAVVSAIISAIDPKAAAKTLASHLIGPPAFAYPQEERTGPITQSMLNEQVPRILKGLVEEAPLCHNMTNQVVQNIAANVAICIGASPIMSNNGLEATDLSKLGGALVINMGTVTPDGLQNYLQALTAYNAFGGPVVFDPVGAGATTQRRDAVKKLMAAGYFDLIKGNEGEIKTVAGTSGAEQQKGVDSGPSTSSLSEKISIVKTLASQEGNIVLMTGVTDILSDGETTVVIENGHKYLGNITGSGCTLGTTLTAFLAAHRNDKFMAILTGILMFEIAAERASKREEVRGPGTFVSAFLDELYAMREGEAGEWWVDAKVKEV
jgi:thiamine-phosphate diphosphorylase/hydroxyethylthiazole kinase